MLRFLPRDLSNLIFSYLPLTQLIKYAVAKNLGAPDFVTILLNRGFSYFEVKKYYTTPLADRLLSPLEMFIKICTFSGEICESSHLYISPQLCIQLAFRERNLGLLMQFLNLKRKRKDFHLATNNLFWAEGLQLLCDRFKGYLHLPSIVNVRLGILSSLVIEKHILVYGNHSYYGYRGYLGLGSDGTTCGNSMNYHYGRLRAHRERNLLPIKDFAISDDHLRNFTISGGADNFVDALTMAFVLDIKIISNDSVTRASAITAHLRIGNISQIKLFSIAELQHAFTARIIPTEFAELTAVQLSNFKQTYEYIKANVPMTFFVNTYLNHLELLLDLPSYLDRPMAAELCNLSDTVRTANIKQIESVIRGNYLVYRNTSEVLHHPAQTLIMYDIPTVVLMHYLLTLINNKQLINVFDTCITLGEIKLINKLCKCWGIAPGLSVDKIKQLDDNNYLEYVRSKNTV